MSRKTKMFSMTAPAAGALLCLAGSAFAGGAVPLTDHQLDQVSAGAFIVDSTADALATGLKAYSNTSTNSIVGSSTSPVNGSGSEQGETSGVAVAWGLNPLGNSNGNGMTPNGTPAPPPTSMTSVTTGGTTEGNYSMVIGGAGTSSALGQTIQVGTLSVYNAVIPGL